MHRCDNKRCINPDHLLAGDWDSNNKDRAAKGRSAKVRVDLRKIDDDQAAAIRHRWSLKKPGKDPENGVMALARDFSVDSNVIYNIVRGKSHVHPA